jgi:hypothetical protein
MKPIKFANTKKTVNETKAMSHLLVRTLGNRIKLNIPETKAIKAIIATVLLLMGNEFVCLALLFFRFDFFREYAIHAIKVSNTLIPVLATSVIVISRK